ncbi:MAG: response regulator [Halolamina sp.]
MSEPSDATVLVADDEEALVELYAAFLADRYEVRTATNGEAAVALADEAVDVVVLDRRMPGTTGDEVLSTLRADENRYQIAMLTAVEPERGIIDLPFDDYRTKPVDKRELRSTVEVLLRRQEYDERSQEFFWLASKKAALEAAGNVESEEYERLTEEIETARAKVDATLDGVDARDAFVDLRP